MHTLQPNLIVKTHFWQRSMHFFVANSYFFITFAAQKEFGNGT